MHPTHNKLMGLKTLGISLFIVILFGCSSVDSTQVFDKQQAANLLHQNHTLRPTRQMIKISLPEKNRWKKIDMSLGTFGTPIMLIPQCDHRNHWQESIRTKILAYRNDANISTNQLVQQEMIHANALCQKTKVTLLSQSPEQMTYRIEMQDCPRQNNQIRIGKALAGSDAIYLIYYTALTDQINAEEINKIAHVIKTAKLVRDPRFSII